MGVRSVKTEHAQLISVLRARMNGQPLPRPDPECLPGVAELARQHKLVPFVYQWLAEYPREGSGVLEELAPLAHQAVFKDAQFDYVRGQITRVLAAGKIDHVFMRGICLKANYPDPTLRTMSDMDILVKPRDFRSIRKAMTSLGAVFHSGDGNHRTFRFPEGVTVEFHPNLLHCSSPVGTLVNPGWQYVPRDQAPGEQVMTEEGFYINVMAHLANHFVAGGVGIRFVLDVWVCSRLRSTRYDRQWAEQEMERVGLLEFARKIEALAQWWFSDGPAAPELEALADYIISSGSHGDERRAMLNAICLSPGRSRGSALWHKIFYPRQDLENRFDWVVGRPWLLPAAWVVRAWKALTGRWHKVSDWRKGTQSFTEEEMEQQRKLLREFGIK